jgi:hypothetical protein
VWVAERQWKAQIQWPEAVFELMQHWWPNAADMRGLDLPVTRVRPALPIDRW